MEERELEDRIFKALADPTRREIVGLLARQQISVAEIQSHFDVSQPAVSQHLRVLRECGLVVERRHGRRHIYSLEAAPLEVARQWLERHVEFWTSRLENLGAHLRKKHGPKP